MYILKFLYYDLEVCVNSYNFFFVNNCIIIEFLYGKPHAVLAVLCAHFQKPCHNQVKYIYFSCELEGLFAISFP